MFRVLANFPNLTILALSRWISAEAERLRAWCGIRTPDVIDVASALAVGAAVLASNGRELRKAGPELAVWLFEGD